jgi:predicted Fe-S protein YdhL (DUF1289 family)
MKPTDSAASPCVSICRMDDATGWCEGCLRTLDEIATWSLLDDDERRQVNAVLIQRRIVWRRRPRPAAGPGSDA